MILVTGGTGLLGAHLLFELSQGDNPVRAIYRSEDRLVTVRKIFGYYSTQPEVLFDRIEWFKADLTDQISLDEAFSGIDQVYHTAAIVSFNPADKDYVINNNVDVTSNIVNQCLDKEIKKLCFVSSTAVIGNPPANEMADESHIWKGEKFRSAYSLSKFKSEMEVWRGIAEGMNAIIVNPSIIIGPGDWNRSSSNLFLQIWRGMKFYTLGVTGYVDVRDVVTVMQELMQKGISGERYIVSSENLSYKEVFQLIAVALGRPPPTIHANKILIEIAWRYDWLFSRLTGQKRKISRETVKAGSRQVRFSNKKVIDRTGIQFKPVSTSISETAGLFLSDSAGKDLIKGR